MSHAPLCSLSLVHVPLRITFILTSYFTFVLTFSIISGCFIFNLTQVFDLRLTSLPLFSARLSVSVSDPRVPASSLQFDCQYKILPVFLDFFLYLVNLDLPVWDLALVTTKACFLTCILSCVCQFPGVSQTLCLLSQI